MNEIPTVRKARGRPRGGAQEGAAGAVKALDRGLALLGCLARDGGATLTELALRAGMPASTAHRLLATLERHRFVAFGEEDQVWRIGVEAYRVGAAFLDRTSLVDSGRGAMRALMEETGETSNLAIQDDGDVVFVSQVETNSPIRAFFRPGARGLMHASGIGKALLAERTRREVEAVLSRKGLPAFTPKTLTTAEALFADLAAARDRGWALDDEERYIGMRCVAAPIFNHHREAVAGISVSGPTVRLPDRAVAEIGPRVARAAAEVTAGIGGVPPERGTG